MLFIQTKENTTYLWDCFTHFYTPFLSTGLQKKLYRKVTNFWMD